MSARMTRRPDGWYELSFPFDRWIIAELKGRIPSTHRSWSPETKRWAVSGLYAHIAADLLREEFDVEIDEGDLRFGRSTPPPPATIDPDFAALNLLPTMPPEIIVICYRELSKRNHPDRGGNTAAMQKINAAFDNLKARGVLAEVGR